MKKLAIMAAAMALVVGLSQCKKNDENAVTPSKDGGGVITLPDGSGERWAILLPQDALEAGASYSADVVYIGTRAAVPAIAENEIPLDAYNLYFKSDPDQCIVHVCSREEGLPVRAVRPSGGN